MESVFVPLDSALAMWLSLASGYQKTWCKLKKCLHFKTCALVLRTVRPLREWLQADMLEDGRPCGRGQRYPILQSVQEQTTTHQQEHHSPGPDQKNHRTDPQNYELKKVMTVLATRFCGTQQNLTNIQMKFLILKFRYGGSGSSILYTAYVCVCAVNLEEPELWWSF